MGRIIFPKADLASAILLVGMSILVSGLNMKNDSIWTCCIPLASTVIINLFRQMNLKHDFVTEKRRNAFLRKHVHNQRSPYKTLPFILKKWDFDNPEDYIWYCGVLSVMIGISVSSIVACIHFFGNNLEFTYDPFIENFCINAFLLSLILLIISVFKKNQSTKQAVRSFFMYLYFRNGKKHIIKGSFAFIGFIWLIVTAVSHTWTGIVTKKYGMPYFILSAVIACTYLVCTFYQSVKQENTQVYVSDADA